MRLAEGSLARVPAACLARFAREMGCAESDREAAMHRARGLARRSPDALEAKMFRTLS